MMSGKVSIGMKVDPGRVTFGFLSLRELIPIAFDVKPYQLIGPDWLAAQRFEIVATLPEGATSDQIPAMLRALLEDRFKLKAHREKREQNVYALEVAKGGPKMKEAPAEATPSPAAEPAKPDAIVSADGRQLRISADKGGRGMTVFGGRAGTMRVTRADDGAMRLEMERVTMADLAQALTPMLDRPVVDHTGLTGAYQISLELSPQDLMQAARLVGAGPMLPPQRPAQPGIAASDPSGGSVFTSVQQLGLRLEGRKDQIDNVVVDSVEKEPSEN